MENYVLIDEQTHESPRIHDRRSTVNETTNMTWAVFDESKGGNCCEHYIATTISGSILNIGGEYPVWSVDRGHDWDTWIPGVNRIYSAAHSSQPTLERKVWARVALSKQPMATSFRCRGSHTWEVTSSWTNSMPSSTMILKWNGNGVTTALRSLSTIVAGKSKSLGQFHRASVMVSGPRWSFPTSGIKPKTPVDKFRWMD